MTISYDVVAIGNAIVDVIAPAEDDFLNAQALVKGSMALIDEARAQELYDRMAPGIETSGGSAANTVAGVASFGGRAAYLGKVANDQLGEVFIHDMRAIGVDFDAPPLRSGPATARCLINVTPDGQRTMCTFLGASTRLSPADVELHLVQSAQIVYLEGYLFDSPDARRAFDKAADLARAAGRLIALSLSDPFVAQRHRRALVEFIDTKVDVLFGNEAEVVTLFETDSFASAIERLGGRVKIAAMTRGAKGSVVVADGEHHVIAAAAADAVLDTTGAGDQYAAGFLFGLAHDHSLVTCAQLGSLAAAEVISHYGPRPQVRLRELAAAAV